MRDSRNQDGVYFDYIEESIRKTFQDAASCMPTNFGPCFGHEFYPFDGGIDFLIEAETQAG